MTLSRRILSGAAKIGRFLLSCILLPIGALILLLPKLKRVAAAGLFLLTCFFVLVFLVGELSVPGPDTAFRGLSVFVLFGLEFFLKSTWNVPHRFDTVFTAGKWWVIFLVGGLFVLTGVVGVVLGLFVPTLFSGLSVAVVLVFFLVLLQGLRMVRWAWKHPAEAA